MLQAEFCSILFFEYSENGEQRGLTPLLKSIKERINLWKK